MDFMSKGLKQSGAARVAKHVEAIRDIKAMIAKEVPVITRGPRAGIPKTVNDVRKKRCGKSLQKFLLTYFPHLYALEMSSGQIDDIEVMQKVVLHGGRFAFADPRGDGKTTRTEGAVMWAMLYGYRRCIGVIGADLGMSQQIIESVKMELRTNELLREDFPIPCWAAHFSDGSAMRAKVLHWGGMALHMSFSKTGIKLPYGKYFDGSGCAVFGRGITGQLRGIKIKTPEGSLRPDMFAVDDPQTDESAASPAQCDTRENLLLGAVLGSGGPGETIACFMPCTIIKTNDMADRMLDRKRHPDFQGRVRGMIRVWPKRQKTMWKEYIRLRRTDSQQSANDYYATNRKKMDEGALVDWEARLDPKNDLSALQHAENLLCDLGPDIFYAEYQNQPREQHLSVYELTTGVILSREGVRPEYQIPEESTVTIAFTDINEYGLHWTVISFANDATAWVVSYGVTAGPEGRNIVGKNFTEMERKQAMYEALVRNGETISMLPLTKGGVPAHVDLWMIDRGYLPDVVERYVSGAGAKLGIQIIPTLGFSGDKYRPTSRNLIGAPGEMFHATKSQYGNFIAFNQHYWFEVGQRSWLGSLGAPGSLSLFAGRTHSELAEHICREKLSEKIKGKDGYIWVITRQPGRHDYGDCIYGCYVGAALRGIGSQGYVMPAKKPKQKRRRVRHVAI